ncbi:MAG: DNA/RNA nuclease SfsA [Candidatus Obscuribacterales bacterium]|nr:DNA/RNA nuclease SfsA [Candidatus Obscuribacterales bacterium]
MIRCDTRLTGELATLLQEELIRAKLVRRYKRFLADVVLDGESEPRTVHCPNPGSMLGLTEEGTTVWLRPARNPQAKLSYGWVLAELPGTFVSVDTLLANKLVNDALLNKKIPELVGYEKVGKEKTFGESRFDFFLTEHEQLPDCYMEVKSTTLLESSIAMFPDAKTERGRKHLEHLIRCKKESFRALQFFCISRCDAALFKAADHIDQKYGDALRLAASSGVEVLAYDLEIRRHGSVFSFEIGKRVECSLFQ